MQLSPKLSLILIPSIGVGISTLSGDRQLAADRGTLPQPTLWKIQTVEPPPSGNPASHQAFLERQKQLTNRDFSCDCNGCRVAAAQVGVKIN